jgi:outer membrane protein OmpA-like peptidoglycan-associated protein
MRGVRLLIAGVSLLAFACAGTRPAPAPPAEPAGPRPEEAPDSAPGAPATARAVEEHVERAPLPVATAGGDEDRWLVDPSVAAELLFAAGSAELSTSARAELDSLAARLAAWAGEYRLELEGHADGEGDEVDNRLLAAQRADAVRRYLGERHGIPLERIGIRSLGEAVAASGDARASDRRVVVLLGSPPL